MCSYNKLNGVHTCSDPTLIGDEGLLRSEGGFRGFLVSDWGATHGDAHETALAGLDVEYVKHLPLRAPEANLTFSRMPGDWILVGTFFSMNLFLWCSLVPEQAGGYTVNLKAA
jgi:beta-glucosidase